MPPWRFDKNIPARGGGRIRLKGLEISINSHFFKFSVKAEGKGNGILNDTLEPHLE